MATIPVSLFFRGNKIYGLGTITFDLVLAESHGLVNSVSTYNVENGADISDHIRNELFAGTVTGLISNYSLTSSVLLGNRALEAFDALVQLWRDRTLVNVVTVLKVYENVVITDISIARDGDSGEELVVDIGFREINIVNLQEIALVASVKLKNMTGSQNKQSAPNLNVGKQQGVF